MQNSFSAHLWCITFASIAYYFFLYPCLQSLEDLEEQRRRKKKERMGLGSLSRVFGRGKQRKSLDPTLFDGTNTPDYYIEEDADWWCCWEPPLLVSVCVCVCVCVCVSIAAIFEHKLTVQWFQTQSLFVCVCVCVCVCVFVFILYPL